MVALVSRQPRPCTLFGGRDAKIVMLPAAFSLRTSNDDSDAIRLSTASLLAYVTLTVDKVYKPIVLRPVTLLLSPVIFALLSSDAYLYRTWP